MKKLYTNSAFFMLIGLFVATILPLISTSQIVSAPGGGLWSSGTTWIGGIVPGATDNVVIASTVNAAGNSCNSISITSGGVLRNHSNNTYSLFVNGNFINDGTVTNNVYLFNLYVFGNFTNNGIMSNNTLTLFGSGNQLVASTQPMAMANFTKNFTAGRVIATTALNFTGTNINLNSDTLEFTTGNLISMNGGSLSTGVLIKSSLPALQLNTSNGAYSYFMTIDATQLQLNGTLLIYSINNFKNNVINNGILQNYPNNSYTLTVSGNFTNNGTVQNNVYNFLMNIAGDLFNNGTWTNYSTVLNGNANQGLAMTQPFSGAILNRVASTGRVRASTGISFNGTDITLNQDTLEFTTGNSISLNGGSLNSGVLYKSALPALQITSGNGTYLYFMTIDAVQSELNGTLLIYSTNNFKNDVTNFGILQNYQSNSYTLSVIGNFTNNGTVKNNVYNFTMNISGNLINIGTWTNYSTVLNGNANQGLAMTQPFSGAYLTKNASNGRVRASTGINFVGTAIDFNSDTLEFTTGNVFTMSGEYLSACVVYKSSLPALQFTSGNNTYLNAVTVESPQTELYGIVSISGNSNNFKSNVINFGTLQNRPTNGYTLTVTGGLTNNGTVKNNVYNFTINISGNMVNNGTWTNYSTILNGTGSQGITISQPFGGEYFTKTASAGRAIATTGLSFVGTKIDFNSDTLEFTTGNALTMSGGYLNACVLYKTSLPAIQLTSSNGNYLSLLTIDSPQTGIYGTVQISGNSNNFKTNLTNYGTLQNRPNNSYTLPVIGSFTNDGNIQNNVYNLSLNISGNLTNNGTWTNYQTTLTGTNAHSLAFSNRFEGEVFVNSNVAGSMTATTDLIFDGTTIDFNDCSITLALIAVYPY